MEGKTELNAVWSKDAMPVPAVFDVFLTNFALSRDARIRHSSRPRPYTAPFERGFGKYIVQRDGVKVTNYTDFVAHDSEYCFIRASCHLKILKKFGVNTAKLLNSGFLTADTYKKLLTSLLNGQKFIVLEGRLKYHSQQRLSVTLVDGNHFLHKN
jgi:hypothetical protein